MGPIKLWNYRNATLKIICMNLMMLYESIVSLVDWKLIAKWGYMYNCTITMFYVPWSIKTHNLSLTVVFLFHRCMHYGSHCNKNVNKSISYISFLVYVFKFEKIHFSNFEMNLVSCYLMELKLYLT